jgi:flavin reductase (DIM6/NTAB) family NADH-FMN oxidoreductase RutF
MARWSLVCDPVRFLPKGVNVKQSLGAKTLLYPTPVLVVGSYGADGRPNVMTAAWGGIACSRPPCVSVSLRAATTTHGNIIARGAFTISLPSAGQAAAADFFGLVSGRKTDKFAATGLTAVRSEIVDAPYVAEFPLVVECAVTAVHELGLHTQFIGEVKDVKVDEICLDRDGHIDVGKLDPLAFAPDTGAYFALGALVGPAYSIGKTFAAEQGS